MSTPVPAPAVLRCDIEVADPKSRYPHDKRTQQPAGARVAVHLSARKTPFVYVLHVDTEKVVSVLLVAEAGPELRLPPAPMWLPLPQAGAVVAIGAHALLGRKQLADLVGGREPKPTPVKGSTT